MTPLQLQMLLHYHCSAADYPNLESMAQCEAIEKFIEDGYLVDTGAPAPPIYQATGKLHAF